MTSDTTPFGTSSAGEKWEFSIRVPRFKPQEVFIQKLIKRVSMDPYQKKKNGKLSYINIEIIIPKENLVSRSIKKKIINKDRAILEEILVVCRRN